MTTPSSATARAPMFRATRAVLGMALAILGQAVPFGAAYVAGQLADDRFDDMRSLGAVVGTLLLGQVVLLLTCVITGTVLIARGRRDLGVGLLLGGVIGAAVFVGWIVVQTR